jgi:hypothetical protein
MFDRIKKVFEDTQSPSKMELEVFTELTYNLIDLMVEFSLYSLRTIAKKRGVPLNKSQIEEAVNFDIQFRLQQIQDPELLDIVRDQAISRYIEEQDRSST